MKPQTAWFLGMLLAAMACGAEEPGTPVLLFTIGMHIEPLGITAQGYGRPAPASYANSGFFDKHVADIEMVARIVEKHSTPAARPYMTFAINVHDWTRAAESAGTLTRLLDLFERHGIRGDFYFTQEITRALAERFPELIERFRQSKMTISYHVRPPHPAYQGFDMAIRKLDDAALERVLLEHGTWATDPATGLLDGSRPGGYKYVASVFGRAPVVVSAPSPDPRIRNAAQRVYAKLGAAMTVVYHETGTRLDQPFEFSNGLLIRPSDFSVTRVELPSGGTNFWWNLIAQPGGERHHPVRLLEERLNEWRRRGAPRPPFITALIHENDFVRRGPPGWNFIYYQGAGGQPARPLPPPWNLDAPDRSPLRPERERELIWSAYEALVSHAAANLKVVTSQDLVAIAALLRGQSAVDSRNPITVASRLDSEIP